MMTQNMFVPEYDPTIENNYRKQANFDGKIAVLDILDTAGQDEYVAMRDHHLRHGDGFILVYSITNRLSFTHIPDLYEQVLRVKDTQSFPAVLAGNKCDMVQNREIDEGEGLQLALHLGKGIPFLETSAKLRMNVNEIFHILTKEIDHWRNVNAASLSRTNATGPIPTSPRRRGRRGLGGMCTLF